VEKGQSDNVGYLCTEKLPKESNRPMGENSPDLVTLLMSRVARLSLVQNTKCGKNIPNDHQIYQMAVKKTK
jgi:hypothetical protein